MSRLLERPVQSSSSFMTPKKEEGMNVVGSTLDVTSPAVATINKGEAYYGDATIAGKPLPCWIRANQA
jgi:hypothetical protein